MKRRRPFKVRGWSLHWSDHVGASFATREAAMARALAYVNDGIIDVRVWEADERGYLVGVIERVRP